MVILLTRVSLNSWAGEAREPPCVNDSRGHAKYDVECGSSGESEGLVRNVNARCSEATVISYAYRIDISDNRVPAGLVDNGTAG